MSRTLDHPLLSIYILRLGSLLFGTSNFALRLPYILAGTATVLPVYYLACRAFSPRAGLLAAALLAVDLFHAGWSRVFMPEAIMLLLGRLAILQFLRTLEKPATGRFVLLGLLMGLAYLAKEPAILLGPAFWICLLIDPRTSTAVAEPALVSGPCRVRGRDRARPAVERLAVDRQLSRSRSGDGRPDPCGFRSSPSAFIWAKYFVPCSIATPWAAITWKETSTSAMP